MGKIQFTANPQKIVEAILYVLESSPDTTVYQMMKILFAADCFSLNRYGAPLTGDRYEALAKGTVPKLAHEMVRGNKEAFVNTSDADVLPFFRKEVGINSTLKAARKCNNALLSIGARKALEHGISEYGSLSDDEIQDKNHAHPAYKNAANRKDKEVYYEDMIEADNEEVRSYYEEIGGFSKDMVL